MQGSTALYQGDYRVTNTIPQGRTGMATMEEPRQARVQSKWYLDKRINGIAAVIGRKKDIYKNQNCVELDRSAKHDPKKWWKVVKKIKVGNKLGD